MHLYIGNRVYSSWSLRPWILMRAKGIAFDETLIQLRVTGTPEVIRKHSPSGKVPCLQDRDVRVWDSLAIMEYLAETYPGKGIWPTEHHARAHARSISAEMHSGFQNLRGSCPMVVTQRFAPQPRPAEVQSDVARICDIWNEARMKFADHAAGPFLYGDFTAADAMYAPVVTRLHTYSIAADRVSQAYIDAVLAHPAYRAWLADAVAEPWVLAQNEDETIIEDLRAKR